MKPVQRWVYIPITLSFMLAFMLMILPLSRNLVWFRPDLVTLVLIYWVLNLPNAVGIYTAFTVGLLFDLCTGMLFGSMALTLSVVAFLTMNLRLRIRIYGFWQKFFMVMALVAFGQLLRLWIQMLIGHPPVNAWYWVTSITSALIWPLLYSFLYAYQRALNLT